MGKEKAYFIGIGGIGMSALAQYLVDHGAKVIGSDREGSRVTELLESKGITVIIGQKAENVPEDATMVIYSDAIHKDHPERVRAVGLGIPELSYFRMLGQVSVAKRTIAIAGTHGKTTTTAMLTKILIDAGESPTAIIGSLVKDFGSNYVHGDSLAGQADLFIVEACEYRDHVLELSPEMLVVTNLEWDHTDWFPSLNVMQETFHKAVKKVPEHGCIVTNSADPNIAPVLEGVKARVVDYTKEAAYKLQLIGEFNQSNARAAAAAARVIRPDLAPNAIAASLASFQGTWRRFEYKGKTASGALVYDDYAHHPTAVRETLRALRAKNKGLPAGKQGKIWVAFHPHLYSRTRDLLDEFSSAFVDADRVLLAPIYAAREIDDGSVSSELLAERIRATGTNAIALPDFTSIEKALREAADGDVIITMGAGDIYKVANELLLAK